MELNKTRTCEKCRALVSVTKMKALRGANGQTSIVCEGCYDKMNATNSAEKPREAVRNAPRVPVQQNKIVLPSSKAAVKNTYQPGIRHEQKQESSDDIRMFCERCKFSFRASNNPGSTTKCPYCGLSDKLR